MIDSEYDGYSFFARHIHFPNSQNDNQINKLYKRLANNISPESWKAMLSYKSVPFIPRTGRIAVRIITNTHIEMTTVIDCEKERR